MMSSGILPACCSVCAALPSTAVLQAQTTHGSDAVVDKKSHDEAIEAKGQLEQHVHDLQMRLQFREQDLADVQSKLTSAASELDDVRAQVRQQLTLTCTWASQRTNPTLAALPQVETGKSSGESQNAAVANMQIALSKQQQEAEAAATAHKQQLAKAIADVCPYPICCHTAHVQRMAATAVLVLLLHELLAAATIRHRTLPWAVFRGPETPIACKLNPQTAVVMRCCYWVLRAVPHRLRGRSFTPGRWS